MFIDGFSDYLVYRKNLKIEIYIASSFKNSIVIEDDLFVRKLTLYCRRPTSPSSLENYFVLCYTFYSEIQPTVEGGGGGGYK